MKSRVRRDHRRDNFYTKYKQATTANQLAQFPRMEFRSMEGYIPLTRDTLMRFPSQIKRLS